MKVAKSVRLVLLGALVGAVGGLVLLQILNATLAHPNGRTDIDLTVLEESMEENNELSTASYLYTSSVSVTDQNTLAALGLDDVVLPWTDATYILEFDGEIKAGYDLRDVVPYREGDDTVVIELPEPEVLSHETGDVSVVYEQQNIANPLRAGEESSWIEGQKEEMEERAISLGLYEEAERNARVTFESLFSETIPEGATIEVRFQ